MDLNNPENRKPYELLILGRYDDQPSTNADPDTPAIGLRGLPAQDKERDETGQSTDEKWTWPEVPLPAPKVFASVPLGHSRKPDVFGE